MTRLRLLIFSLTIIIVAGVGSLVSLYARGYRFNPKTFRFSPRGLLVIKSNPDGAQIFINDELKTATNTTIPFPPGTYDVSVKKEGFYGWSKRLTVEKEVVTEVEASLFKITPSLTAVTFNSVVNPIATPDFSKIAYAVPATPEMVKDDKEGLWVMETGALPLGFPQSPRRITEGSLDLSDTWMWSPDKRQVLLLTKTGTYLLDANSFTPQSKRVNISSTSELLLQEWEKELNEKFTAQTRGLATELIEILTKANKVIFSPDSTRILYLAGEEGLLAENLIPTLPGASTQKQERTIKPDHLYVYDIKEDRNFLISPAETDLSMCEKTKLPGLMVSCSSFLSWFPTSRHLFLTQGSKIIIMDYDGTNRQEIYSGSYFTPFAFPVSTEKILILTNLGANSASANLYSLGLK